MEGNRGDRLAPGSSTQGPTPPLPVGHSQRLEKTCGKSNSYHAYPDQGINRGCGPLPCPQCAFISLGAGTQPCQTRGASLSHRGPARREASHSPTGAQPYQTLGTFLSYGRPSRARCRHLSLPLPLPAPAHPLLASRYIVAQVRTWVSAFWSAEPITLVGKDVSSSRNTGTCK